MTIYKFKFHFEKKPDQIIDWKDTDNISEPFKEYSRKIKEDKEELIFYYKGSSFKYQDSLKNKFFKEEVFGQINPEKAINIFAFPLRKTKKLSSPLKLSTSDVKTELPNSLSSINIIKEENENKKGNEKEKKDNLALSKGITNEVKEEKRIEKEFFNDVLCPHCSTSAILENNYYKLNIINCENFHRSQNISYDRFEIVDSFPSIKCASCSIYRSSLTPPENQYYKCICGFHICPECYKTHAKEHNKIKIENQNYECILHNRPFNSYCLDCNMNICENCVQPTHTNHEILKFIHLNPKDDYIKNIQKEVDEQKKNLTKFINNSKKALDDIIREIENYLNNYILIEKTLLKRFNDKSINFQLLQNLRNKSLFYDNKILNTIKEYNDKDKDKDEINNIETLKRMYDLYTNINKAKNESKVVESKEESNKMNEMIINYSIKENGVNKRIKMFDSIFVDNNRDKLRLIIDGKEEDQLIEYYNNPSNKKDIQVKIIEKKPVTNMSYMFNNCKYLMSLDSTNWDTTKITNMESLFQLCSFDLLENIMINKFNNKNKNNNFSIWKTPNLTNMRAMFCKCINLKEMPEMSKWDTKNVKDMSLLFNGCISIENLSKFPTWNTQNVEDMSYMFSRCIKLKEIHNIQKWNTYNVKSICGIFNRCEELTKLSNIGNWTMNNVTDISIIFQFCCKLEKLPDINKWNVSKVKDMSGVFSECSILKNLPNIGKWNTSSVESMSGLFNGCNSLTEIPDISNWDTNKVTDMSGMFCDCQNIIKLNISKWDTRNVTDMSYMFDNCSSLKDTQSLKNMNMSKVIDKTDMFKGCN